MRQAIAHAIDREFLLNAIYLGTSQEARTGIHPGSPFYEADVEPYDLDLDKANEILDGAGYPRGADGIALRADPRLRVVRDQGPGGVREAGAEEDRHRA